MSKLNGGDISGVVGSAGAAVPVGAGVESGAAECPHGRVAGSFCQECVLARWAGVEAIGEEHCHHYADRDVAGFCRDCIRERWAEVGGGYGLHVRENRSRYLAAAGTPLKFRGCGIDTFAQHTRDQARALAELVAWAMRIGAPGTRSRADGIVAGLYLYGPVGTGKTHLAVAALLELLATGRVGRFVALRDLLLECRESFRDGAERRLSEILEDTLRCDALVLDDLGAEKATEFSRADVLLALVDRAYSAGRPALIVTSNLGLEELGRKTDARISDRLHEMCTVMRLAGPSWRRRSSSAR